MCTHNLIAQEQSMQELSASQRNAAANVFQFSANIQFTVHQAARFKHCSAQRSLILKRSRESFAISSEPESKASDSNPTQIKDWAVGLMPVANHGEETQKWCLQCHWSPKVDDQDQHSQNRSQQGQQAPQKALSRTKPLTSPLRLIPSSLQSSQLPKDALALSLLSLPLPIAQSSSTCSPRVVTSLSLRVPTWKSGSMSSTRFVPCQLILLSVWSNTLHAFQKALTPARECNDIGHLVVGQS